MRTLGDTRALARALTPVSGTCRRSPGAGVCIHPCRLDYIIFYTGCYSLRIVVSAGLVGLPGGWGRREVGHQSTRKKKVWQGCKSDGGAGGGGGLE